MNETAVFESMIDAVAGYEVDGTVVYLNAAAGRLFGRPREELLGRNLWQLFPEAPGAPFRAAFERVARTGRAEELDGLAPAAERWLAHQICPAEGRLWVFSRDITEQKTAAGRLEVLASASRVFSEAAMDLPDIFERVARQVAEALRDLCAIRPLSPDGGQFEAPIGIWDVDPTYRTLLQGTPAVSASEGIGPELLRTGQTILMAHVDPAEVAARIAPSPRRDLVERLQIHSVMAVALKAGGQIVGLLTVGRRRAGTAAAYTEADRRLLEELADRAALVVNHARAFQLVESARQRLNLIGDSLPVLVSLLDRNERYLFVNATYQKWFGQPPAAIVGHTLAEVVGPAAYEVLAPHVRAVLSGRTVTFQTPVHYARGGPREIEATYVPYRVDGEVTGFVALVADVSDRVHMQEKLQSAVSVRDDFLSMASHELRTPLAALQLQMDGVLRMLNKAPEPDRDKLMRRLATAGRQVNRLSSLVDGLLDVSRLGRVGFLLAPERFDLATLVREVVERFEEEGRRSATPITADLGAAVVGSWDRNRLDQALTNLLSNAMKYGPGQPITVTLTAEGEQATLAIRDQGIGIAPADLDRIFGRFERAVPTSHYGGLGLGLYVAGRIVRAHGGTIDVQSEPERGATFTIRLPLHPTPPAERAPDDEAQAQWWP